MTGSRLWARGGTIERYRLPLSALGLAFLAVVWLMPSGPNLLHGFDLVSYWAVDPAHPYLGVSGLAGQGAFRYAPPVAFLFGFLKLLPFGLVQLAWMLAQLGCLWFIGRRWFLALVLFPPVLMDLFYGNVNIFLGAMIVAGFRYPGVWALALLTKVTPGVGLVWFVVRREWRQLAIAGTVTVGIVGLSVIVQGTGIWADWLGTLSQSAGAASPERALAIPLALRLAVAVLIIGYAGITDRRWLLPIGVVLAMPVLWAVAFAPLIAVTQIPVMVRLYITRSAAVSEPR